MTRFVAVALLIGLASVASAQEINPAVSQSNLGQTICRAGWAKAHRPPVSATNKIKRQRLGPSGRLAEYELDHIIPLALGGCSLCESNLQLQRWPEARRKDVVETRAWRAVCRREISLEEARRRVLGWKEGVR